MNETVRDLIKSTLISIGAAMAIFCLVGIVFDVHYGGQFQFENYRFTKMVIGCLITGLGFGVPSIVYKKDTLPMPIRTIVHLGIGCVVYTIVAYAVGWIGGSSSIKQGLLIACIQFAVVFLIWFLFFRHYKREADAINKKISEINS